jgi:DNA adenine methylase
MQTLLFDYNKPLKPLIKWSGGKGSELKLFRHHYPNNFKLYIEPFIGGGAVFFNLNFKRNVISDVHEGLINFYQQIKNGNAIEIYNRVSKLSVDEPTYYYVRDTMSTVDPIDRAVRFYYLRKTAFRGMLRYNKKGKFNIPWGRYKNVNFNLIRDPWYTELLKNTDIRLLSFEDIFEEFDNEYNFMFLDPPYDSKFTDYGYCQFGREFQTKLADLFKASKNKCLMVIGDSELIRELYEGYIVDAYYKKYMFKIHSGRVDDKIDNQHLVIKNY